MRSGKHGELMPDSGSITSSFNLSGRVAIVTGATGLLGREYSDALAEAGANVVLVDLQMEQCAAFARDLTERHGVSVLPIEADISDEPSAVRIAQQTAERFGRVDILVNNA